MLNAVFSACLVTLPYFPLEVRSRSVAASLTIRAVAVAVCTLASPSRVTAVIFGRRVIYSETAFGYVMPVPTKPAALNSAWTTTVVADCASIFMVRGRLCYVANLASALGLVRMAGSWAPGSESDPFMTTYRWWGRAQTFDRTQDLIWF